VKLESAKENLFVFVVFLNDYITITIYNRFHICIFSIVHWNMIIKHQAPVDNSYVNDFCIVRYETNKVQGAK
jgi:hypothetical protein